MRRQKWARESGTSLGAPGPDAGLGFFVPGPDPRADVGFEVPLGHAGHHIGRTGGNRSRAWIGDFSSIERTTAPSDGLRYGSATSWAFSTGKGSVGSLSGVFSPAVVVEPAPSTDEGPSAASAGCSHPRQWSNRRGSSHLCCPFRSRPLHRAFPRQGGRTHPLAAGRRPSRCLRGPPEGQPVTARDIGRNSAEAAVVVACRASRQHDAARPGSPVCGLRRPGRAVVSCR